MNDARPPVLSGSPDTEKVVQPARLWNLNFILLWQGQLVSALGDTVYAIALGFWILAETGSTAIMGTLMAVSTLPRVLIAPFAGVIVDRSDRKWMLVITDALRGCSIVAIAIAAYTGYIRLWMVFAAGIIISACGAFFNPSVGSSIPDIVPKDRLVQANSIFSIIYTGSGIIGNSGGGFLYTVLGAPFMFLFNGLSYIFSAITECFIRIPRIVQKGIRWSFFKDMRDGFTFIWNYKGLRLLMIIAGVLNFFANIGIMLFLPLFQQQAHLGPGLYGLFMGFFTGGLFLGYLLASSLNIAPGRRFAIFTICGLIDCIGLILLSLFLYFPFMAFVAFVTGVSNAILNSFIMAVMQMTTPQDKRGKVFGLLTSLAGGLTPIAFAIGGILADVFSVRLVIAGSFTINLFFFIPLFLNRDFRAYIGYDPMSCLEQ